MKYEHSIQRAKERYNLDLTVEDCDKILWNILNGRSLLAHRNGNHSETHYVSVITPNGPIPLKAIISFRKTRRKKIVGYLATIIPRKWKRLA